MKRILGLAAGLLLCGVVVSYGVTQETPIGKLSGKLTMKENGKPLAEAVVSLVPVLNDEDIRTRGAETKEDGSFSISGVPTGTYYLELSSRQHHWKRQVVSIEEGKTLESNIVAEPNEPSLDLYASQKVFTPDEVPKIELHGFMPSEKNVKIDLYRMNLDEVVRKGGVQEALSPLTSSRSKDIETLEKASIHVADLSHPIEKVDAEGAFIESVDIGKQPEGLYFILCRGGGTRAATTINVSQMALVAKAYDGKNLCYTTRLKEGTPIEGAEILTVANGVLTKVATTDRDGLADIESATMSNNKSLIIARKDASVGVVGFWKNSSDESPYKVTGYCERPAYRPGDTIHFKGIVRRETKNGYELPGTGKVDIRITDPDGNELTTMDAQVSSHGTFSGEFRTSKESRPGGYAIECEAFGARRNIYANVVSYRKPEFSIDVQSDKSYYTMGDKASATVECHYYYGGPVVGAKVQASIYRTAAWGSEDDNGDMRYYSSGAGEYTEEVEAVTDASGRAKIVFPTRADDDPEVFTNNYTYTVNASVTEDDAKYFDGSGEVNVLRGDHNLSIEVENPLVAPGESIDLLVKTTDPINEKKPSPGHVVSIEIGREEWTQDSSVFVPKDKVEATTGPDGIAHVKIPVKRAETMAFRATSKDGRGNLVVADTMAYVEGSTDMRERLSGTMQIILDKKSYRIGDKATALIETDMPGGSALVTIEANGILMKRTVSLPTPSTRIELPVVADYNPNVYLTVAYVKDKKFLEADRMLIVEAKDHDLKIEVSSDQQTYKPGGVAMVTVRTIGSDGKPHPAEVSLGVVDEGIYDIAEDETNLKETFYPSRSRSVTTNYSFAEIYLDGGDKGTSKVPLRKTFRDTAQWNPAVWTGENGVATVPVRLPDNLTEWRVTAVGISDDTQVGMTTENFRVKKDLMVRLQLPQFMVDGDQQRMVITVANDTGQDQDVNLEVQSKGLTMSGDLKRVVHVPNGKPQPVEFEVTAGGPGDATVTARAWIDGGVNDGVEQSFPIAPHGRAVLEAKAGEGSGSFSLPIRSTSDPKFGSLKISLSPTLAGDLVASLDGLIDFPYGCVEQTMSRFMPSILVDKAVRDLGLPRPKKLDNLPMIVQDSLARLYRMRHSDGGFGWWEYDESDPFMTALVLDGLDRAKQAGLNIDSLNLDETLQWTKDRLAKPQKNDKLRDRLYLAYAAMRFGQKDAAKVLDEVDLAKQGSSTLSMIALAAHQAGNERLAIMALDQLVGTAQGNTVAYWPAEEGAWGDEPTATALVAFETVRPSDPIVPKIVRHLQDSRKGSAWSSTRDTAYSLIGLTAYLKNSKELEGTSSVTVMVNDKVVRTTTLNPKEIGRPDWTINIPRKDLGSGEAKVEIRTEGTGACYYSAELHTLDIASMLTAESSDPGLKVERKFYRLEPRALENGTTRLLPSRTPVGSFQSGELVRVELTITSDAPREFVMIEEPTPSSCRIQEREEIGPYEEWSYWWCRTVIRDDRIAFFARTLPKGVSKISYTMRAEQPGKVRVLPTTVANMYDPSRSATASETPLEVTR